MKNRKHRVHKLEEAIDKAVGNLSPGKRAYILLEISDMCISVYNIWRSKAKLQIRNRICSMRRIDSLKYRSDKRAS
jgi:hypothetical protein